MRTDISLFLPSFMSSSVAFFLCQIATRFFLIVCIFPPSRFSYNFSSFVVRYLFSLTRFFSPSPQFGFVSWKDFH